MGKTERKVRKDKKIDVKPTVEIDLYECVSRISHITYSPMKDVAEHFCKNGLYSKKVIELLSKKFRRNYKFQTTLFRGDPELLTQRMRKRSESTTRITIRFSKETYDEIAELAYAMDTTLSTATAVLLEASVQNTDIVSEYVNNYIEESLDEKRKEQLRLVLEFIRKENPYQTNDITIAQLFSFILDEFMDQSRNIKKTVENWLDKVTEET
ncbi:hypothetical protein ABFV99_13785 [Cytobacillus horneckiae]|uniref:hypothetical protein n=1 Tax=Cytobacillus horneckiae TaxID=549687 RepID=UPI0034CD3125